MVNFEGFPSPAVNIEGSSPAAEESAFAEITKFTEFQSKTQSGTRYDVFINHHGKDVKKTLASLLYYNLCNKNLKVFLDDKTTEHGDLIPDKIRHAINTASVHIAIFSENYAKSAWCLSELCLMEESGAPIIPIFCGVQPSELRVEDKDEDTAYSKALHKLEQRFHRETIKKWTAMLQRVSYIRGFLFEGDQGILLEKIAACVIKHIHTKRQSKIRRLISGLCWEAQDMPCVLWLHDIATCTK